MIEQNVLNNNSIVCKLNYNGFSLLFTGDIEKIAEEKIVEIYSEKRLKSNVLKVAHHGSKSSSIQEFVDCVEPEYVLIGVGEKNKFGHPNIDVIDRYINSGAKVFRTDTMGEISIQIRRLRNNENKISINTFL